MTKTLRRPFLEHCDNPRDVRNALRLVGYFLGWAVVYTGASQLIKRELVPAGPISWFLAVLATLAGVVVIIAYARFLRQADELQRTIQLQALAIAFGGTFFGIAAYEVFERIGAPRLDIGDVSLAMAFLYTITVLANTWRYR